MADLITSITMRERYRVRTQAAFVRAFKGMNMDSDRIPAFNIPSLLRIRDMNPHVYACSIILLDMGVEDEPTAIRESKAFKRLIELLSPKPPGVAITLDSQKASLVLLEVFIYMVLIHRARLADEAEKAATRVASSRLYEEEELL